jgi:hypothetical protein
MMRSPFGQYPQGHNDVFDGLLRGATATTDMRTARNRSELSSQARDFANRQTLQGLQNDMAAQGYQNNLLQSRMDGVFGPAGNLLRGLFT